MQANVRARIGKKRTALLIFKKIWNSREIGKSTKLRMSSTNVKSVLLLLSVLNKHPKSPPEGSQ